MRTQFFYSRKETIQKVEASSGKETPAYIYRKDSFNLNHVVRSIEMADGAVLVLLDDIHERTTETPSINTRSNKMAGMVRKRDTYQSEIYLTAEDGERFYRACAVDEPLWMDVNALTELTSDGIQEIVGKTSVSGDSRGTSK